MVGKFRGIDNEPGWERREFKALWKAMREEKAARRLASSSVGGSGTTGATGFRDLAGHLLALIGSQSDNTVGVKTFRPNGTPMLESLGSGALGLAYTRINDANGNALFNEDAVYGGLAAPRLTIGQWVPFAPMGSNPIAPTSSTYVTVETAEVVIQSAFLRVSVRVSSSAAGATGNFRVLKGAGDVVVSATAIPVNALTDLVRLPLIRPASSTFGLVETFRLQVNLTGTGTVGARGLSIIGSSSYDLA